jgi:hypothetical protein
MFTIYEGEKDSTGVFLKKPWCQQGSITIGSLSGMSIQHNNLTPERYIVVPDALPYCSTPNTHLGGITGPQMETRGWNWGSHIRVCKTFLDTPVCTL